MAFCVDCHAKTRPELTECKVCHSEISKETKPQYRATAHIPHDAPQIWETVHGQQWRDDPAFCKKCHESQTFCEDCHRKNAPSNHTISWRRKTHGLRAEWDRSKCAVCHEEDMCLRCHKHTEPSSHRAGWGEPGNRHCLSCHYPPQETNCTVCHESIDHRSAPRSPHDAGLYPPRCAVCHPGGVPYRAPHPINSTVRCVTCH